MRSSYTRSGRKKAITVRVPENRLKRLMRARRAATQSILINDLLSEEEERLRSEAAIRDTSGAARANDFDDRFL
jgi:hypothetical protein